MAACEVRFGVIADIQAGDLNDKSYVRKQSDAAAPPPVTRWRRYRRAFDIARSISQAWSDGRERFDFVLQLGDIIEGNATRESSEADLKAVLEALEPLSRSFPFYNVMGNHCLRLSRSYLLSQLPSSSSSPSPSLSSSSSSSSANNDRLYYSWVAGESKQWRLVTLDGLDISLEKWQEELADDQRTDDYRRALAAVEAQPALEKFNGAIGPAQLEWFEQQLIEARRQGQRALVFCHLPTLVEAANARHVLWNYEQVLQVLDSFADVVVAWVSGHWHEGGYALHPNGIHHLTIPAVLECSLEHDLTAAIFELHSSHLEIIGLGDCPSRTLPFSPSKSTTE